VLIVDDQDAPGGIWDHWVVFNIDPKTKEIFTGKQPGGVSGKSSSGNTGYVGPCPPNGTHRYFFTVYALDTILSLPTGATKDEVMKAVEGHVIEKATLVGMYTRWQKAV
jgi:Raf kinase inhibitor-like YbhB/YbcL family protein